MKKSLLSFIGLIFLNQIVAADRLGLDLSSLNRSIKDGGRIVLDLQKIEQTLSGKNNFGEEQFLKIAQADQISSERPLDKLKLMIFPLKSHFQTYYHKPEVQAMFEKNESPDKLSEEDQVKAELNYILDLITSTIIQSGLKENLSKDKVLQLFFVKRTMFQFFGPPLLTFDEDDQILKCNGQENYLQFEGQVSDPIGQGFAQALNTPRFSQKQNNYAFTLREEFQGKLSEILQNLSKLGFAPGNQLQNGDQASSALENNDDEDID